MKLRNLLAAASAILALSQTQIAMAQAVSPPCVEQADLSDAVVYSMPSLLVAFDAKCGPSLADDGFIRTQGSELSTAYAAKQEDAWPGAKRFIMQFSERKSEAGTDIAAADLNAIIGTMPAEALRPFVDALIQQKVAEQIPVKECSNIEHGVSLLAPLPPENLGDLAAFLFKMADVKNPSICESEYP